MTSSLAPVADISCGGKACVARKIEGTAEAWGDSVMGNAGDASSANLTNIAHISCGGYPCVALKNDGTAEAWGHASFGGDASSVDLTNVALDQVVRPDQVVHMLISQAEANQAHLIPGPSPNGGTLPCSRGDGS